MSTVAKALLEAQEEIFITDWMYVGKILVYIIISCPHKQMSHLTMYLYCIEAKFPSIWLLHEPHI